MKWMQSAPSRAFAVAVLLGSVTWLIGAGALGQNTQRSVQGRVVSGKGVPIRSAIVYLSDVRTMDVESYITQNDGAYRFERMSPDDDYKVWAKLGDKKSKTRTLSSFDDRKVFYVNLKIPTGK